MSSKALVTTKINSLLIDIYIEEITNKDCNSQNIKKDLRSTLLRFNFELANISDEVFPNHFKQYSWKYV